MISSFGISTRYIFIKGNYTGSQEINHIIYIIWLIKANDELIQDFTLTLSALK